MLVVHHLSHSRSQRILWLLEELDVPYEIRFHEREGKGQLAPEALKSVHPLGKSPVITDAGHAVAESGAIIDYIIRRHGEGRLAPSPDSWLYDQYVQWLHYAEGSAALPLIMKGLVSQMDNKKWRPLRQHVDVELDTHLGYIDQSLEERDYLVGNTFSAADVQMSFIGELAAIRTDTSRFPNLEAWVHRFQRRPAYQAAIRRGGPYALGGG
jgi:glutathione S-transferase